ncbi:4Fe-4S dicluster domain-containing protein [Paenibacillus ehimensis]|nr:MULTISPECIES: 4Fe-4S dicluster domain-containing protein [Paenibacillus]MBU7319360.1 4Fe-4S dicluster domain-containing protein [Paenibacillus oleatilyticus]MCM3270604.1 4Fe-4S dicluster domain-containing protein [Paenibacillus elgii]MCP1310223.1 4Fe-4S dicluster domain-containing protein [Paenibacillus tyrfis]MDO3677548.1 4Fe-4S dicluster domain-containing protein [Paenibacillus ehimensis]MEC0208825.1 4Fe-4S dicluster domain-containing protein [Paenibacillus ehimensis]
MEGDEMSDQPKGKGQTIEEKQYLIRFKADTNSHLHVLDYDICATKCPDKICTIFCPAEVYKWEEIRMHVGYEGCHECGSCRIGCPHQNIKWEYPKGGHGIIFRLG